jgi:hypothetical protein
MHRSPLCQDGHPTPTPDALPLPLFYSQPHTTPLLLTPIARLPFGFSANRTEAQTRLPWWPHTPQPPSKMPILPLFLAANPTHIASTTPCCLDPKFGTTLSCLGRVGLCCLLAYLLADFLSVDFGGMLVNRTWCLLDPISSHSLDFLAEPEKIVTRNAQTRIL